MRKRLINKGYLCLLERKGILDRIDKINKNSEETTGHKTSPFSQSQGFVSASHFVAGVFRLESDGSAGADDKGVVDCGGCAWVDDVLEIGLEGEPAGELGLIAELDDHFCTDG